MDVLTPTWTEYELIDSGAGRKLERFGEFVLVRPEPQAQWTPALPMKRWESAAGEFAKSKAGERGEWKFRESVPTQWRMQRNDLHFWVRPSPSGHVGVFPDQACHWDWIAKVAQRAGRHVRVLSLFGHTGLATLAAAAAGAEVTHVDSSRKAVAWARENQALSGLSDRSIRWVVEDALTFVTREARRGNQYDALLLDPPRFGRGPDGELWKLEKSLPQLLRECAKLLSASPAFLLLNLYVTVLKRSRTEKQATELGSQLSEMLQKVPATITTGELVLVDSAERRISASVFARTDFRVVPARKQSREKSVQPR